jgi:hypothetical protein
MEQSLISYAQRQLYFFLSFMPRSPKFPSVSEVSIQSFTCREIPRSQISCHEHVAGAWRPQSRPERNNGEDSLRLGRAKPGLQPAARSLSDHDAEADAVRLLKHEQTVPHSEHTASPLQRPTVYCDNGTKHVKYIMSKHVVRIVTAWL